MNFITQTFGSAGVTSTLLYLCLAAFMGVLLGKIKIFNIKVGIAGVLFSGIIIAHFGAVFSPDILSFVRDFGLILFVYSIGLDMGPRFFSSFKKDGLTLNILAMCIVFGGFATAYIIYLCTNIKGDIITGIMCGSVTNTPGLGAAQQVLTEHGLDAAPSSTGYAVAYPFGVIGIILTMLIVRLIFKVKIENEGKTYTESLGGNETKLQSVEITVTNPNMFGKKISYINQVVDSELAVSRIFRDNQYILATPEELVKEGDVIYGVSAQNCIDNLKVKMGDVAIRERGNIQGDMAICNVLFTNQKFTGKTIEQIGIHRRYSANITRIYRSGMELLPTRKTTLELGDNIKIVGDSKNLDEVKKELGNSDKELAIPHIVPIFLGIFIGILVGSIPIAIPGLPAPAKLGLAGGPLLVAILLGYKGRIGTMNLYMTPGANLMLREFGIILFLSSVGLLAGKDFVQTIVNGGWQWMIYGALITFIPIFLVSVVARLMKINYLKICGCISGAMTDPPALEFANSMAPVQAQSTAYAMVYPLTMFLRVLLAQLFILLTTTL